MKSSYPEFKAPSSYIIPEGVQEGETFEDIAQFRVKANGQICLTKIGDSSLEEDNAKEEPDDFGSEQGLTSRITEAYRNRNV